MPQAGTQERHPRAARGGLGRRPRRGARVGGPGARGRRCCRTTPVRGPREDVAAAVGVDPSTDCVFHVLAGLLGLGPNPRLELEVVLADGTRVPAGWISAARGGRFARGLRRKLRPLIVNCPGRSGSTFLMKLLAAHPEVVVFRRFPYESTPARYWMHMLSVLAEPANLVESTGTDDVQHRPLVDRQQSVPRRPGVRAAAAGGLVRRRPRRGAGRLLPAQRRRLVHDARAHAGPARRGLLRREAHVAGPPAAS